MYSACSFEMPITCFSHKPFLLGVKTFKRKLCYIESTIVPSYNSIMGAIFEYDINQAYIFIVFRVLKVLKLRSAQLLRVKKPNLFNDKTGVFLRKITHLK